MRPVIFPLFRLLFFSFSVSSLCFSLPAQTTNPKTSSPPSSSETTTTTSSSSALQEAVPRAPAQNSIEAQRAQLEAILKQILQKNKEINTPEAQKTPAQNEVFEKAKEETLLRVARSKLKGATLLKGYLFNHSQPSTPQTSVQPQPITTISPLNIPSLQKIPFSYPPPNTSPPHENNPSSLSPQKHSQQSTFLAGQRAADQKQAFFPVLPNQNTSLASAEKKQVETLLSHLNAKDAHHILGTLAASFVHLILDPRVLYRCTTYSDQQCPFSIQDALLPYEKNPSLLRNREIALPCQNPKINFSVLFSSYGIGEAQGVSGGAPTDPFCKILGPITGRLNAKLLSIIDTLSILRPFENSENNPSFSPTGKLSTSLRLIDQDIHQLQNLIQTVTAVHTTFDQQQSLCHFLSDASQGIGLFTSLSEGQRQTVFSYLQPQLVTPIANSPTSCHPLSFSPNAELGINSFLQSTNSQKETPLQAHDLASALLGFLRSSSFTTLEALYGGVFPQANVNTLLNILTGPDSNQNDSPQKESFLNQQRTFQNLTLIDPSEAMITNHCLDVLSDPAWKEFQCPNASSPGLFPCLGITTGWQDLGNGGPKRQGFLTTDFYGFTPAEKKIIDAFYATYKDLIESLEKERQQLQPSPSAGPSPSSSSPLDESALSSLIQKDPARVLAFLTALRQLQTLLSQKKLLYQNLLLFLKKHQADHFASFSTCTSNNQTACAQCLLSISHLMRSYLAPLDPSIPSLEETLLGSPENQDYQKALTTIKTTHQETELLLSAIFLLANTLFANDDGKDNGLTTFPSGPLDNPSHPITLSPRLFSLWIYLSQELVTLQYTIDQAACLRNDQKQFYTSLQALVSSQNPQLKKVLYTNVPDAESLCNPDKDPSCQQYGYDDLVFQDRYACQAKKSVQCQLVDPAKVQFENFCCDQQPPYVVGDNFQDISVKLFQAAPFCALQPGGTLCKTAYICQTITVKVCQHADTPLSTLARVLGDPDLEKGLSQDAASRATKRQTFLTQKYPAFVQNLTTVLKSHPCPQAFLDGNVQTGLCDLSFMKTLYTSLTSDPTLLFTIPLETVSFPTGGDSLLSSAKSTTESALQNIRTAYFMLEADGFKPGWDKKALDTLKQRTATWLSQGTNAPLYDWEYLFKAPNRAQICQSLGFQ